MLARCASRTDMRRVPQGVFHPMVTCKPPRAQYNDTASLRPTYFQICDAPHRFS